ncbi:unnamed protein product [Ectocarpus sp. CCAP 1310/34]|nr:unnamed protein product [Ectocarpus sp. CCAP 1310/34]
MHRAPLSYQGDGHETADDGSSGGLLPEDSAMPDSLVPSSSTTSGPRGVVRGDVGNNRRGMNLVTGKDGHEGFLSQTAFAAMLAAAARGDGGSDSDDNYWDTVIDDEAGFLPVVAREEEAGREARSSSPRTKVILADPPSPGLFRAGNDYDRGAEVLIPPEWPGGVAAKVCPPPRLIRFLFTPEGRVVASNAAVIPIPCRKRRVRGRQRRVLELDVPTTAAASVSSRTLEFDGGGCSSGGGGASSCRDEAVFDRLTQRQARVQGDDGGSSTPGGAFKSPAPDANAASYRRRIPPTLGRKSCAFDDEESDDDDETAEQDGGEGKNMEHQRTRSTTVLGRLKGMLNLESKPRSPPVGRMSRIEMHKASLIAESFRSPGGPPLDWSSPAGFNGEGFPHDGALPGTEDANGQRERPQQMEGRRGGGRSMRAWRARGRRMAGSL